MFISLLVGPLSPLFWRSKCNSGNHGMSLNGGIWLWVGNNGRNIPYHSNMDFIVIKLNFVFSSSELDNERPIQRNATTDGLRKIYILIDDMDACSYVLREVTALMWGMYTKEPTLLSESSIPSI